MTGAPSASSSACNRSRRGASCRHELRDVLAPRLDDADRLLGLRDPLLQIGGHRRRRRDRLLALRQRRVGGALVLAGAFPRASASSIACSMPRGRRAARFPARERADLLGELRDLLRDPRFALAGESELLLEPRDLGIGFVVRALPLVQGVARRIVVGAQRLQLRLGGAHVGLQALEGHGEVAHRRRMALAGVRGVLLLRIPEQVLRRGAAASRARGTRSRPSPARRAFRAARRARSGCPRRGRGSCAFPRAAPRFPCAAPCTWRRRPPPRGTRAAPRAWPRSRARSSPAR